MVQHDVEFMSLISDGWANTQREINPVALFIVSLKAVVFISFCSAATITSQYAPVFLLASDTTGILKHFVIPLSIVPLVRLYRRFLELYTTFMFRMEGEAVRLYQMERPIKGCTVAGFLIAFFSYYIVIIVWFVLSYIDHETMTGSLSNPYYWAAGICLSPTFMLFLITAFIALRTRCKICKLRKEINAQNIEAPLLINSGDDASCAGIEVTVAESSNAETEDVVNEEDTSCDKVVGFEDEWNVNKSDFHRILCLHFLLLVTWVVWRGMTMPFVSLSMENGETVTVVKRDDGIKTYWILYVFTTAMKILCTKLGDVVGVDLFNGHRVKTMIGILVEIMFAFGLKFVFTNVKEWASFLAISIINSALNIFVNGSFQSHQYGKSVMNRIKKALNKMLCDKLEMTDFDDLENVKKYNKELAFGLSVKFVIQSSSCLICMAYFGMNIALGSHVDDVVFAFMAMSFAFECVVYFGQILVFKKRDRAYFIEFIKYQIPDRTSWDENESYSSGANWCQFVAICLCLAWCWVGALTGVPADVDITG